jgi:hypothetical protein
MNYPNHSSSNTKPTIVRTALSTPNIRTSELKTPGNPSNTPRSSTSRPNHQSLSKKKLQFCENLVAMDNLLPANPNESIIISQDMIIPIEPFWKEILLSPSHNRFPR